MINFLMPNPNLDRRLKNGEPDPLIKDFTIDDFLPQNVVNEIKSIGYKSKKTKYSYIFYNDNTQLRCTYDPEHEILIGSVSDKDKIVDYALIKSIGEEYNAPVEETPDNKLILKLKDGELRCSTNDEEGVTVYSFGTRRSVVINSLVKIAKYHSGIHKLLKKI